MVSAMGPSGASPTGVPHRPHNDLLVPWQERPCVEPQPPFVDAAYDWRVRAPELLGQRLGVRTGYAKADGEGRNLARRQGPAAAASHRRGGVRLELRGRPRQLRGQPPGPLFDLRERGVEHPEGRDLHLSRTLEVGAKRRLERSYAELVGPQRPREWVTAHRCDELERPNSDAGLRPAEQLVPREDDEIRTFAHSVLGSRLIAQRQERSAADVCKDRRSEGGQLRDADRLGEACDLEVARVDPEYGAGVLVYGFFVVGEPGAVRGSDLAQPRPGELEHLGDAETAPDLNELAARDDDLRRLGCACDHRRKRQQ